MPHAQKGMCYAAWDKDRYASEYSDRSLENLANLGAEYISIVITRYQNSYNSTKIIATENTPSDISISHVIRKAHSLGLKVMLKPHLDLLDTAGETCWRADIGFADENDWKEWFKEYRRFILHYAGMAKRFRAESFCVGTELSFTSQKDNLWRDEIISNVRKVYSGKLTYASNWDNYQNIKFWDELDYIGIDAYFPLSHKKTPSQTELRRGWEKWKMELRIFHSKMNKPIIFTEIGYPSSPYAAAHPWKRGMIGNSDTNIQAMCYKAFFDTMWDCPWLEGVYWWKWDTSIYAGGKNNRQFTPQNKPAEKILNMYYKKGSKYA
ncbi:MAG: hypothetical protein ABIA77_04595 [Candidatus Omnitrophota bacterium]